MTVSASQLPRTRRAPRSKRLPFHDGGVPLGRDDYLELPEDGTDSEIIFGILDVAARPFLRHQRIAYELASSIDAHVAKGSGGDVTLDIDLLLDDQRTFVSPDLMYFTREQMERIDPDSRVTLPPALVIEIISSSSSTRDRVHKRQAYARAGIPHYWIADPSKRRIEELILGDDGAYHDAPRGGGQTHFQPALFPGLAIDLVKLFR